MITYKDIDRALTNKLIGHFNIAINSNDVKKGFEKPSFFVEFDNAARSATEDQVNRSLTIRIYYFPTDRNDNAIELLEVQEALENIFDLKLEVLDRKFNIDEVRSDVTDGVLNFSFDITYFEGKEITENEAIQEIHFNLERVK